MHSFEVGPGVPARRRCVLTVFAAVERRAPVHDACASRPAAWRVLDAPTPTEAVLALLSRPIDLVLADADWPPDLLQALQRHARRSAPGAGFLLFGDPAPALEASGIRPWAELPCVLEAAMAPRP